MSTKSGVGMKLTAAWALGIVGTLGCGSDAGATNPVTPQGVGTAGVSAPTTSAGSGGAAGSTVTTLPRAYANISPLQVAPSGAAGAPAAGSGAAAGSSAAAAGGGGSVTGAGAGGAGGAGGVGGASATAGSGGRGGAGGTSTAGRGAGGRGGSGATTSTAGRGGAGGAGGMAGSSSASTAGSGGMSAAAGTSGSAGSAAAGTSGGAAGAATGSSTPPPSISGTATFVTTATGVDLNVMVTGCIAGKSYPIHIHEGMSCDDAMTQKGHWGPMRGEMIPNINCGTGGVGATTTSRDKSNPTLAWSLGDMTESDVVGHVLVIHDADNPTVRIACGKVTK